jgi:HEAT repeat protein
MKKAKGNGMRLIALLTALFVTMIFTGCVSKKDQETIRTVDALVEVKEFGKALDLLTRSIQETPKSKPLHRRRIILLLKADRVDLAIAAYHEFTRMISEGKTRADGKAEKEDAVFRDAVHDKDPTVRGNAARALSSLNDLDAFSAIAKLAKDPENEVRRSAVYALGDLKDERAVDILIEALKDSWWFVRSDAAQALGRLRDAKAVPPLFVLLEDADKQVQRSATNALTTLVREKKLDEYLVQLKSDKEDHVKVAAFALASVGNREAIPQLLLYVTRGTPDMRPLAMRAIGQVRDPNTISVVRQGLQDADAAVRHEAIIALVELQDVGSIELLKALANKAGEDQVIRQLAARAADRLIKSSASAAP